MCLCYRAANGRSHQVQVEMQTHDVEVRDLEVAQIRLAGVMAGTQCIEDVLKKGENDHNNEDTHKTRNRSCMRCKGRVTSQHGSEVVV